MKKKQHLNNNLNYPLIIIVVFSLIAIVYIIMRANREQNVSYLTPSYTPTRTIQTKIYSSKEMKFSIDVPTDLKIDEKFFRVTLSSANGNIYIERNGTNFSNIDDYLNDLDKKNNSVTLSKEKININNFPAIRGIVNGDRYYFIYADKWTIFTLFVASKSLFSDLDKIAQSFRYTP